MYLVGRSVLAINSFVYHMPDPMPAARLYLSTLSADPLTFESRVLTAKADLQARGGKNQFFHFVLHFQ